MLFLRESVFIRSLNKINHRNIIQKENVDLSRRSKNLKFIDRLAYNKFVNNFL
jgi:hypothetical protein